jgi:hypothetical protein
VAAVSDKNPAARPVHGQRHPHLQRLTPR